MGQLAIRDDEVRAVVERVRRRFAGAQTLPRTADPPVPEVGAEGLFETVDAAVEAASHAFTQARTLGLERRRTLIDAVRQVMRRDARELAHLAREETGIGRAEDKVKKNLLVTDKTPGPEDLEPQVWSGDRGLTVTEYAPFGVVAAITPTTNPTATIIHNTLAVLSAGNALVFNVHPNAKRVSAETVRRIHRAIVDAGGPADLVTSIAEPTLDSARSLMEHPAVRLLLVTGGPGVVDAALATRKRAITAGPGNPPVVVDESADLDLAGREIVRGASFDNNVVCTDEKEVFVVEAAAPGLLESLQRHGALLLPEPRLRQLERVVFRSLGPQGKPGEIEPRWIGQDAAAILREIGVAADEGVRLVVVEVQAEHPLVWTEQMMPVLPVVRVPDVDRAIALAVEAEHGFGHTASIYSRNVDTITRMAREIDVSILTVNAANLAGLGDGGEGYTSYSIASPTGEGLTRPRSFARLRRLAVAGGLRIV